MRTIQLSPEAIDALVRQVQAGDKQAFSELLFDLEREVRLFISARASGADMTEEILQAAFVTCFERIRDYEPRGTFVAWLKGIARNLLRDELREQARVAAVEGARLNAWVADDALARIEDAKADGLTERLFACIERLSPSARDLVRRRYTAGDAVKSIAANLNKSETWVSVTLFRVRETLRACVEKQNEVPA